MKSPRPFSLNNFADDADSAGSVDHVQRSLLVTGSDLHCGVFATGRRPTDEQRQIKSLSLHLFRNVAHFVERRRDQTAEANHIHVFHAGGLQNLVA